MKRFYWLLRRETWENRSFVAVPAAIAALVIFFMLIGAVQMMLHLDGVAHFQERLGEHTGLSGTLQAQASGMVVTATPFNLVMLILIAVYLLDSLYAERRDRSILFWKSLPVSDTAVVLSKLATAALVVPLITLAVVAATQLVALLIGGFAVLMLGIEGLGWVWNPLGWLLGWSYLAYGYVAMSVVLLPYMAWLLLASSWARRTPFLWAAIPPLVLMILERWFLGSHYLARTIFGHLGQTLPATFRPVDHGGLEPMAGHGGDEVIAPNLALFAEPSVWIGLFFAALFVAGAIGLRRYRDDS